MDKNRLNRFDICDIPIDYLSMQEVVEIISEYVRCKRKTIVFTPNVDHIVKAKFDREFKEIYSHADLSLVDGMPLVWVSSIYGKRLPERISATNLVWRLCKIAQEKDFSFFLLGTQEEVARLAAENMKKIYPGLKIVGYHCLPFMSIFDEDSISKIINKINSFKPDILLVGFGSPNQEKWIYKYHKFLEATIFLGVGSTLDLISGRLKRAPRWMQDSGLEWLFRLSREPRRLWKRYLLGNTIFLFLLAREVIIYLINRAKPALTLFSIKKILDPQEPNSLATKLRKKRFNLFKSLIASLSRPLKR